MAKILVLYYSTWGHVEALARAEAEGARSVEGVEVTLKRVPETMPAETVQAIHARTDLEGEIATPVELADYDAIIFGTPTRFGNMAGQMRNFLDQTGGLWAQGRLVGKIGSVFTSTATQQGGKETTLLSFHTTLMHHGMIVVGVPYSVTGMGEMEQISGGSPWGASTLAGADGSRAVTGTELAIARAQGQRVAELARKLFG